jgi:hypothetical protein
MSKTKSFCHVWAFFATSRVTSPKINPNLYSVPRISARNSEGMSTRIKVIAQKPIVSTDER